MLLQVLILAKSIHLLNWRHMPSQKALLLTLPDIGILTGVSCITDCIYILHSQHDDDTMGTFSLLFLMDYKSSKISEYFLRNNRCKVHIENSENFLRNYCMQEMQKYLKSHMKARTVPCHQDTLASSTNCIKCSAPLSQLCSVQQTNTTAGAVSCACIIAYSYILGSQN